MEQQDQFHFGKNYSADRDLLKILPDLLGVYVFKDETKKPIYIGKAKNLKNRVTSYFGNDLLPKTRAMVSDARYFSFIIVGNEFEALLLEAKLVRKHMPKYNIQLRDDKSPLYIVVTQEEFPRVITLRRSDLDNVSAKKIYGPFLSGIVVRKVLRQLRKVFPFSNHKIGKRACIYSQIGLCRPCPNTITTEEQKKTYLKNIRHLSLTLSGKARLVRNNLEREMQTAAKELDFETAKILRNQIKYLDYINTPMEDTGNYVENPNFSDDLREKELAEIKSLLSPYYIFTRLRRIECFDIAHLASSFPTASMVTFVDGDPERKYYRHFKIYTDLKGDTDRMAEVLTRRKKHFEDWDKPDLIVVDGGKPQVSAAINVLGEAIPVVGIAKRYETLVVPQFDGVGNYKFVEIRLKPPALYLFQRMRDEAHRFSRRLHHKQVEKIFEKK